MNEAVAFTAYPAGYLGTTLASFYTSQGALLYDAFAAGNLVGGTPCARPEDCEVHPSHITRSATGRARARFP